MDTDGTCIPLIYGTSTTPNKAPVRIMEPVRNPEGPTLGCSSPGFSKTAYSLYNIDCCRLLLICSHCTITWSPLNEATRNLVMNHRQINLAILLPRNSVCPWNRSPKINGSSTPNPICLRKLARGKMGYPAPIHSALKIVAPVCSGEATPCTRPSVAVTQALASPIPPVSV